MQVIFPVRQLHVAQNRRYYSFTHHQLCQKIFLPIKIPHLIDGKTAAFKTTWRLLLCCSTMICKVVNIWLILCWVCCVVLGQKLVLSTILDLYIYACLRAIWAHFRRNAGKKTGRLGSRLASGRGLWHCHSSTWSYPSSTHLIHDCSTSAPND